MKNLPALALALVCTTGFFVAPAAHAATATITWPSIVNLNLPAGTDPSEDIATRRTDIAFDDGNASSNVDFSEGAVDGWGKALSKVGASATPTELKVTSPGTGNMVFLSRATSWDFSNITAPVSGSLAFNYTFEPDASLDPNAFLNASISLTIVDKLTSSVVTTISPMATAQTSASPGDAMRSGVLSLNFTINPGQAAILNVALGVAGAPAAAPVPVPAALPLLVSALAGVAGMSKRRRNKGAQI